MHRADTYAKTQIPILNRNLQTNWTPPESEAVLVYQVIL